MGSFELIAKTKLADMNVGEKLAESDFASVVPTGEFVQFKYVDEDNKKVPTIVHPGIWSIGQSANKDTGLALFQTEFVKEDILPTFCHTKAITEKINKFFSKLDIYKKHGIEVPKRGMLLYGPGGTGKTSSIKLICNEYASDKHTAVILWPSDKIGASDVKEFIKTFEYKDVSKMILVVEDLGGVEVEEVRVESRASLLSLLDNQEKTFTIPVLILATTNHPEIFNGNLTNRPGRFSDKIEVGYPKSDARKELFKFFLKERATEALIERAGDKKYEKFSPAHLQEVLIRSELYDSSVEDTMDEIAAEIKAYEKAFVNKRQIGMTGDDDY